MEFLNPFEIVSSSIGVFHTSMALLAMIFGGIVLYLPKGTLLHKRLGYVYAICMLLLNVSAFAIYNTGGFSLFHFFALVSLLTLILGILPAWRRKNKNWYITHYYFMSWSAVGLYAAFWAELGTRMLDMRYFWWAVMIATGLTCGIGAYLINKKAKKLL